MLRALEGMYAVIHLAGENIAPDAGRRSRRAHSLAPRARHAAEMQDTGHIDAPPKVLLPSRPSTITETTVMKF
jgi:hypothetical protein